MELMKDTGIVICSRLDSTRIPRKALLPINGKPVINHLAERCLKTGFKTIVAVPPGDLGHFIDLPDGVILDHGDANDPLLRLKQMAENHRLKQIIRICHDKILIDPKEIVQAAKITEHDYIYPLITEGAHFEVISYEALKRACRRFKNVEHVSYAINQVSRATWHYNALARNQSTYRFLIDYPEDVAVMELILSRLGNDCTLDQAIRFMQDHPWVESMNRLPEVTVYTCAYNVQDYICQAMESVASQTHENIEYILVDDHSADDTFELMAKFKSANGPRVKLIRNHKNLGLSSSCNVALKHARGKYIMRLDGDDFLSDLHSIRHLLKRAKELDADAIYPHNYYGSLRVVQSGQIEHHAGGALFKTRALNYLKFTNDLRGYEGYDLYSRAKSVLKIGYLHVPTFFYRQREGSLSHGDTEERNRIRNQIDRRLEEMG